MKIAARLSPILALLLIVGCGAKPLTQVYAARQTYTASLDGLTTAINAGQISDRATLVKIKDLRTLIEKGLDDSEAAARAGNTFTAKSLLNQVETWLEEYLILSKPATRPTSLNTEPSWTPQRSSPSSWAALRQSPDWCQPTRLSPPVATSPMSRWQAFEPSRLLLRPETTPR